MNKLRKYIRIVSAFLLINFLFSTFLPTISYALTSGPTAPEATSFEPVDTTNMVNPVSGDFTYNIPLLEVPGPSGGYPLALSYHPGIMPNEEASWVGLGWTLNTGAINRNVNGFADDFKNAPNTDRFFWEGGETKTYNVGVSYGVPGVASVSADLEFSQDTYQGFGVGHNIGGSLGAVNISMGQGAYGANQASVGVGFSVGKSKSMSGNISASYNDGSFTLSGNIESNKEISEGFTASVSNNGASFKSQDVSIQTSSNGISASYKGGQASVRMSSNKSASLSSSSTGFQIPIPVIPVPGLWINLGYTHTRYWIDRITNAEVNGALYNPNIDLQYTDFDNIAFDAYDLPSVLGTNGFLSPDQSIEGRLMSYDDYTVNAQGIMGSIRPYQFKSLLFRQNRIEEDIIQVKQYTHLGDHYNNLPFEFRFINDFSNRYINPGGKFETDSSPLKPNFEDSEETGENNDGIINNHLAGSRHIEYLTNDQIINSDLKVGKSGFIESKASGFDRLELLTQFGDYIKDQIGGFVITNESGVKYHFSLPAYSYREYQYSGVINEGVETFTSLKNPNAYAYTWYLTAITGPDFVDRGTIGEFDDQDWGYWVAFDYGKWTDTFDWRNPGEGKRLDLGNRSRVFSAGKKQLYYLDQVKTKTHTALFVKNKRNDAKSNTHVEGSLLALNHSVDALNNELEKVNSLTGLSASEFGDGGFMPVDRNCKCELSLNNGAKDSYSGTYKSKAVSSLKLDRVILVKNADLQNIDKSVGDEFNQQIEFNWSSNFNLLNICEDYNSNTLIQQLPDNVLDIHDGLSSLENQALKVIKFNSTTDPNEQALTPETFNSYDADLVESGATEIPLEGKLTLKALEFQGRGGASGMIPPISFDYDLDNPKAGASVFENNNGWVLKDSNTDLEEGDLIKIKMETGNAYALIDTKNGTDYALKILGDLEPAEGMLNWQQTMNPPYSRDFVDVWGLYKPDYEEFLALKEKYNRNISNKGVKSTSAWSLRKIKTQSGASINVDFEPDDYSESVLNKIHFPIQNLSATADGKIKVIFDDQFWNSVNQTFSVGSYQKFLLHVESYMNNKEALRDVTVNILEKDNDSKALIIDLASYPFMTDIDGQELGFYEDGEMDEIAFLNGHVLGTGTFNRKGGGLRVKSITIDEPITAKSNFTEYEYKAPGTNRSSGSTSYEPNSLLFIENPDDFTDPSLADNYMAEFNQGVSNVLKYARFVPAPGVIYEYVTVREGIIKDGVKTYLPNYLTHKFAVMDPAYIDSQQLASSTGSGGSYDDLNYDSIRKFDRVIKDYSAHVSSLLWTTEYDQNGNPIKKSSNEYLIDKLEGNTLAEKLANYNSELQTINSQGVIQETFINQKFVKKSGSTYDLVGLITRGHYYPSIVASQTTTDYVTGISVTSENLGYDFYSGVATKTKKTDGYGNIFVTETTPAYRIYNGEGGMGLAINGGKNMLTQTAANYTYTIDASGNKESLVSANVQTWNDEWKYRNADGSWDNELASSDPFPVWRKHKSYNYQGTGNNTAVNGDGLMAYVNPTFNSWETENPGDATLWQKNSEITLYDRYSHALEAKDVNGNFAATKMDSKQEKVLTTVANASYNEFAYSGAEDELSGGYFGGVVSKGAEATVYTATNLENANVHSGYSSLSAAAGKQAFSYKATSTGNRKMIVSVWSNKNDVVLKYAKNGGTATPYTGVTVRRVGANGWYLLTASVAVSEGDQLETWCEAGTNGTYFDDFRVHPIDAPMTAYVYNKFDELAFVLDNNNLYTEYKYDEMGRLKETYRESFKYGRKKVSEYSVHYSTEPTSNK